MKGKRGYIIGLSIIILIFGIYTIKNLKSRKANDQIVDRDEVSGLKGSSQKTDQKEDKQVGFITIDDEKMKAPSFKFIDQNKDTITEKDYTGKVYIVEFFYTTCPTICPVMNANLVKVSKEFQGNKNFGIASFSIDPEHDTPEVLKKYKEKHQINNPDWHFMTGDQTAIYTLAQKGFKLNAQEDPNEPGGILHDGMFALIDKDGYIRSRRDEFGNPILYYRGYIEQGAASQTGQEEPQINALIEDIKYLLHE